MKIINNSICAPKGFLSCGIHAGLKKNPQKNDLAIIFSERPAVAAGVYTINQIKAAPVILSENHVNSGPIQAIVINSGNANACTGVQGMADAVLMAETTATALHIATNSIAVASTGVIGVPLPIAKVVAGINIAATKLSTDDRQAAAGILTTDTFTKTTAVEFNIADKKITIGGIAKGSGMIHPMMATMLAFITTDAAISKSALQLALDKVTADSFHMISVDGDTSTNDMVLVLANGMAENNEINDITSPAWQTFVTALQQVCTQLAKQIVQDGEGATKVIEINITGAATKNDARIAARAVSKSSLVKTAIFGQDANWGRIASAIGASGIIFNSNSLTIYLDDLLLFQSGQPVPFDEAVALEKLQLKTVIINADLGMGSESATGWGCDLTYDYVKINAAYRS